MLFGVDLFCILSDVYAMLIDAGYSMLRNESSTMTFSDAPLMIKEVGSFFTGGKKYHIDGLESYSASFSPGSVKIDMNPNGYHYAGQIYTQFIKLSHAKAKYPIMMWHGGGMTGASWETKPDGNPGFQTYFLHAGYDVYISDSAERGRSSFSKYPEIYKSEPCFRTMNQAWSLFRIGAKENFDQRESYPNQQFPVSHFDDFCKQLVPRWLDSNPMLQEAYNNITEVMPPFVLIAHSQAAFFAFNVVSKYPDKIKAVVLIEPGTPPDNYTIDKRVVNVPHLIIWGDYISQDQYWSQKVPAIKKYCNLLKSNGVDVDWIELTELGIRGNSHLLMMDANSDKIAEIINDWLLLRGVMK